MPLSTTLRGIPEGLRFMATAAFFFSIMTVCVKFIGTRIPSAEIVFVRSAISASLTYWLLKRQRLPMWGRRKGLLVLRGVIGFVALLCFFFAIARLPLADVTVIQFTHPVFVAILAAFFLGERVGIRELSSLALSITGVLMITRPSFLTGATAADISIEVVGIALMGAVLAAAAYVLVRKLRETEHALVVVFYFPLVSMPAAVPVMWKSAVWPTGREWLLLLGVGLATQIAQVYLTRGLHAERAARATSVSYLQIVLAIVWGVLLFSEIPDFWGILGAILVCSGILVVSKGREGERSAG